MSNVFLTARLSMGRDASGFKWVTVASMAVVFGVSLAGAWWILSRLLASDRGLDLSDEGFYLLAADPPSSTAAWGFPFGWHVRPLFMLVNYDIASFRTLGAVLLVACSAWLGFSAGRVSRSASKESQSSKLFPVLSSFTGAIACLLFYAPMLRTPSYNWLNLVGITIAAGAVFTLVATRWQCTASRRSLPLTVAVAAVASLALFSTIPAKPTTLPIMLVLTTAMVLISLGRGPAITWASTVIALLPVWLVLAQVVRLWPGQAVNVFRLALELPTPDPLQTPRGAIRAALLVPTDLFTSLFTTPAPILTVLTIGIGLAVAPVLVGRMWIPLRIVGFLIASVAALAIAGIPVPIIRSQFEHFHIANANVTTGCLVVLLAAIFAALPGRQSPAISVSRSIRVRWGSVAILALLPFVFSFGSGNGIYAQASLAGGFVLLAAVVCVLTFATNPARTWLAVTATFVVVLFAAASLISGWQAPFRAAPLTNQTQPTTIGSHGSTLLLETRLSDTISDLRAQAEAAGWSAGTPIVDVSFMWNPTIPYALGGRVPDYLALTIFGFPAAHDITDFHLTEPYRNFPYEKAWFVTSRPESIPDPNGQAGVDITFEKLTAATGLSFPDSYACITVGDFILWRPVEPDEGGLGCEG